MASRNDLSLERLKTLVSYDAETGVFTRLVSVPLAPAGSQCLCKNKLGYIVFRVDGRLYLAHRLAWFYMYGEWPGAIDHINGDRSDNRLENLRAGDQTINMWNAAKSVRNTSGLKGASRLQNGKWRSQIVVRGQHYSLGWHDTAEEAHAAYVEAALKMRGFVSYDTEAA